MTRAAGLLRTLHWVVAEQPELLDAAVVQQVEALAAADDINPAVQVRGPGRAVQPSVLLLPSHLSRRNSPCLARSPSSRWLYLRLPGSLLNYTGLPALCTSHTYWVAVRCRC